MRNLDWFINIYDLYHVLSYCLIYTKREKYIEFTV